MVLLQKRTAGAPIYPLDLHDTEREESYPISHQKLIQAGEAIVRNRRNPTRRQGQSTSQEPTPDSGKVASNSPRPSPNPGPEVKVGSQAVKPMDREPD